MNIILKLIKRKIGDCVITWDDGIYYKFLMVYYLYENGNKSKSLYPVYWNENAKVYTMFSFPIKTNSISDEMFMEKYGGKDLLIQSLYSIKNDGVDEFLTPNDDIKIHIPKDLLELEIENASRV